VDLDTARITVAESLNEVNGRIGFGETKTSPVRNVVIPAFLVVELRVHLTTVGDSADALIFTLPGMAHSGHRTSNVGYGGRASGVRDFLALCAFTICGTPARPC
jgi:hypothetical protein